MQRHQYVLTYSVTQRAYLATLSGVVRPLLCFCEYPELAKCTLARMLSARCLGVSECIRNVHVLFCESCFIAVAAAVSAAPRFTTTLYTLVRASNRLVVVVVWTALLQSRKRIGPDQSSLGHCLKKCSLFLAPFKKLQELLPKNHFVLQKCLGSELLSLISCEVKLLLLILNCWHRHCRCCAKQRLRRNWYYFVEGSFLQNMLMDPIPPGGLSAMDHMAPTGNHGGHTNGLHHHHGHVEHVDEMEDREVLFYVLYLHRILPLNYKILTSNVSHVFTWLLFQVS